MQFPFQLRSITSSCPSGAFFRYSHFWLLYGFRIGSGQSNTLAIAKVVTKLGDGDELKFEGELENRLYIRFILGVTLVSSRMNDAQLRIVLPDPYVR